MLYSGFEFHGPFRPVYTMEEISERTHLSPEVIEKILSLGLATADRQESNEKWFSPLMARRIAEISMLLDQSYSIEQIRTKIEQ